MDNLTCPNLSPLSHDAGSALSLATSTPLPKHTFAFTLTNADGAGTAERWSIYVAAASEDEALVRAREIAEEDGDLLLWPHPEAEVDFADEYEL